MVKLCGFLIIWKNRYALTSGPMSVFFINFFAHGFLCVYCKHGRKDIVGKGSLCLC